VAALGVYPDDANLRFVVKLQNIFHPFNTLAGEQLRDVDQASEAQEVDEGAKLSHAAHLAKGNGSYAG